MSAIQADQEKILAELPSVLIIELSQLAYMIMKPG